jgi:16S rRNA (adenine1518-N6/adenine1519-N6)-dimethyltransferase
MELCNKNNIDMLLDKYGLRLSKSMGQNFLTAPWVPVRIAEASGADKSCGVLEIGPGVGALTAQLSKLAAKVTAVELDKGLIPLLKETLAEYGNINIINNDMLKTNIIELVNTEFQGLKPIVCANLPYNITSPLLAQLIDSGCFDSITVMIQKEAAQRLCAKPGSPEYGAFTVYINYHTKPKMLFDVSPDCFTPRPKVYSSVVRLETVRPDFGLRDERLFFEIVKASFAQRRKTLANGLLPLLGSRLSKEEINRLLISLGFDERVRGETLSISDFVRIANAIPCSE